MDARVGWKPRTRAVRGRGEPATPPILPGLMYVAAFVCAGLERLGRDVGFPLAVIAATRDPIRHARRLSETRHAAWTSRGDGDEAPFLDEARGREDEFDYVGLPFDPAWLGTGALPPGVALVGGALAIAPTPGASPEDVSSVLRSGLTNVSYERLARRPDQVRRRFATRRPVVVAPRYALVAPGRTDAVVPVDDLFRFRPRDLVRLADTVSLVLGSLDHARGLRVPAGPCGERRRGADSRSPKRDHA